MDAPLNEGFVGSVGRTLTPLELHQLLDAARAASSHAYAPYSRFHVGAALLTETGRIVTGCNVENASLSLTICAERVALVKAVSEGDRHFRALALVGPSGAPCPPCGACLQALAEFDPGLMIVLPGPTREPFVYSLDQILALPFTLSNVVEPGEGRR